MFFRVIDDFLHKTYFKEMQQSLESDEFPWYFNKNITYNNEEADNVFQDFGFTHWFVHEENGLTDTQLSHFVKPFISQIMDTIDYNKVLRARAECRKEKINPYIAIGAFIDEVIRELSTQNSDDKISEFLINIAGKVKLGIYRKKK